MSFIIKGFETDGNCLHCYFQSEDSDRCILTDDDIPLYGKGHPDSCPLLPLPEGHGRLGDLDALINELQNLFDKREKDAIFSGDRTVSVTWNDAIHHIIAAPTIVPAEESDN